MINKTLVFLIFALIIMVALITAFNLRSDTDIDSVIEGDNEIDDDEVIDELDATLLDEDSDIDIGDMI